MKQGKEPKGYEKETDYYSALIQKAEYQLEILTTRFINNKLTSEEIEMYKEMCRLIALAKSAIKYDECGKYVNELTDLKVKFIYMDKKRKMTNK